MSMITLFSAFMGLYVIVRLILPSGMNWPLKLILSLFALACAEKLLLTKLIYGTMGAFIRILGLHAGAARAGPVRLRYAGSPAGPSRA